MKTELAKENERQKRHEYYLEHKEAIYGYCKKYRETHLEHCRERDRNYMKEYNKSTEERAAKKKEYNRRWRETHKEYAKEYYKTHKEEIREKAKKYYEDKKSSETKNQNA